MEQVELPRKTKIAAYVMKFMGLFLICFGFLMVLAKFYLSSISIWSERELWAIFALILGTISFILGPIFSYISSHLLKREKKFWWISILVLSLLTILSFILVNGKYRQWMIGKISRFIFLILLLPVILLILLLLDRKNFFKIAE